jgi:putative transposase
VKTVPRNVQVVAQDELPELGDLPEALSVALADIVGVAKEGLLALSVATGLSVMQAMFEAEVTAVTGPKGKRRASVV